MIFRIDAPPVDFFGIVRPYSFSTYPNFFRKQIEMKKINHYLFDVSSYGKRGFGVLWVPLRVFLAL